MISFDYPPMPAAPEIPNPPFSPNSVPAHRTSTKADVLGRGLKLGAISGMAIAAAYVAVPSLVLLVYGGVGALLMIIAGLIGGVVGAVEGLIGAVVLYCGRGWIDGRPARAAGVGALAAAVLPAGFAIWIHTPATLAYLGSIVLLASTVAAATAGDVLWNRTERVERRHWQRPA